MAGPIQIKGQDFWVKVVEMLQQNWALIEPEAAESVRVYFINDTGGVFDELVFPSSDAAIRTRSSAGDTRLCPAAHRPIDCTGTAIPLRRSRTLSKR